MRVLSLFDGISCGRVALERAWIPVTQYIASEIDKHAIKVSQSNYPDIIRLGDVRLVRQMAEAGVFGHVDLLIGGSPCQGFSFAGEQLAFQDPRSVLFFEFVWTLYALRRWNPNIRFMLENVKMKKEHLAVITQFLGVQPVRINSALVSAQNRERYYWCNWPVSQPVDRGIYLRDIIESGDVDRDKSYCIDANYYKGGSLQNYLDKSRRQIVLSPRKVVNVNPSGNGMNGWVYDTDAKSPTLTTNKGEGSKITTAQSERRLMVAEVTGGRVTGRKIDPITGKRDDYAEHLATEQRLEIREDGKAGCITTVQKDSVVVGKRDIIGISVTENGIRPYKNDGRKGSLTEIGTIGTPDTKSATVTTVNTPKVIANFPGDYEMITRIHSTEGKSPTLIANPAGGDCPPLIGSDAITYRKLTPVECERLQTLPDNYTTAVSNTQRYKTLGNGWTVEVIAHILREMPR